jgi:hypothetical protein
LWAGSGSRSESNETALIIGKWTCKNVYTVANFYLFYQYTLSKLCLQNFATFMSEISQK